MGKAAINDLIVNEKWRSS